MDNNQLERLVIGLAEKERSRCFGKYRGIVIDVDDPEGMGRLRARVPGVRSDFESPWALPCSPCAGEGIGLHAVPKVDSAVWIEFEGGDLSLPIWSGGWWASGEPPKDEKGNAAKPPLKILRSEQGLMLALDDDGKTATISDADGSNFITINVNGGEIRVQCTTKVIVEAPKIDVTDNAAHPVVFGDDLLTYLNQLVTIFSTHTHVGETVIGIPVTPMIPSQPFPSATPALLSQRVKTG